MKLGARAASFAAFALISSAAVAGATPHTFAIDRAHSEVGFDVRHFFTKAHGRFEDYTADIVFDDANLEASHVNVVIRDSSVNTQNDRRDAHLRTQDFFWADKYPTITFVSTKVAPGADKKHFKVAGNLTIRDVTKPVTLYVEYLGMGPVSLGGHDMGLQAGFNAKTTIDRKDFGIVWNKSLDQGGLMLGDDVDITLTVAAVPPQAAPPTQKASVTTVEKNTATASK
jgi:polyisoprenoid-binding protein YceI